MKNQRLAEVKELSGGHWSRSIRHYTDPLKCRLVALSRGGLGWGPAGLNGVSTGHEEHAGDAHYISQAHEVLRSFLCHCSILDVAITLSNIQFRQPSQLNLRKKREFAQAHYTHGEAEVRGDHLAKASH